MRYSCFASTVKGEFSQVIINASNDDDAMSGMYRWLKELLGLSGSQVYTVAGVWEKDPKFYTATKLSDLAGCSVCGDTRDSNGWECMGCGTV
jgi:hypothetical protein